MDTAELRAIINQIEVKSKKQSRVDTGMLERSIYGIINERGVAEFGEMFYGQFGTNSRLAENIKSMFPRNEPYRLIYYDFDGNEYVKQEKTQRGRVIERENLPKKIKDTQAPKGSKNIRNFIGYVTAVASVRDSETKEQEKQKSSAKIRNYLDTLRDAKINEE